MKIKLPELNTERPMRIKLFLFPRVVNIEGEGKSIVWLHRLYVKSEYRQKTANGSPKWYHRYFNVPDNTVQQVKQ